MVPRSKISRKRTLILVTLGSTSFPFLRIRSSLDKISKRRYEVVYGFIPPDKLVTLIKKADKIIAHAGPGTLHLIAKYSLIMTLIIPRSAKYKEHVNDHQVYFARHLKKSLPGEAHGFISFDENPEKTINTYLREPNIKNYLNHIFRKAPNKKLEDYLHNFISSYEK